MNLGLMHRYNPDTEEVIEGLPGIKRWGLNTIEGHLRPLIDKGLKSVLIFGIPKPSIKVNKQLTTGSAELYAHI